MSYRLRKICESRLKSHLSSHVSLKVSKKKFNFNNFTEDAKDKEQNAFSQVRKSKIKTKVPNHEESFVFNVKDINPKPCFVLESFNVKAPMPPKPVQKIEQRPVSKPEQKPGQKFPMVQSQASIGQLKGSIIAK